MRMFKHIQIGFLLLIGSAVFLIVGCQTGEIESKLVENTPMPDPATPNNHPDTEAQEIVDPSKTAESILSIPTSTPTIASVNLVTPTPLPTATKIYETLDFNREIAIVGRNESGTETIGIFDHRTKHLDIIANPMHGLSFGRGFWSPDRDLLAFTQFDLNTSTNSLQVYDQANDNNWYLEIEEPHSYDEDDTLPGLFLFGWSGDSEWLAYDYIYDVVQPDPKLVNLLNVFTMANVSVEIPNPDGYLWLAWSPDNSTFAVTNSKSIFVGETQSSEQLVIHPGQGFLGLIAWHPHKNFLEVGSSDNMAVEGINQLWQLNLDTGEWVHMGSYQHINNVAFSPNGHYLAVHSQYLELKHLDIVDATTFKTIHQIDLPMDLLFDLDWINDSTVGLTSKNNIFVIPLEDAMNSYWLFEPNSQLYNNSFSQINIMDW